MRYLLLLVLLITITSFGQGSDFSSIDFTKADSLANSLKGESLKNLPVLTHKLTASLETDVEKFRAIYTWVSTNIENDYSSYLRTSSKRKKFAKDREAFLEWNNSFTPKVFKKLVNDKKTACTGYAYLIKELATLADLPCKIVAGYGRTATLSLTERSLPNHSWNAIELNNKWYLCDATWSAGRIEFEDDGPTFVSNYHDGYFLANPNLFVKNHYPVDPTYTFLKKPPTFASFIDGPVIYKEAFKPEILPIAPKQMHVESVKNSPFAFILQSSQPLHNEVIVLVLNNGNTKVVQPKISKNNNQYTLLHTFTSSGSYDVHIKINDLIIATYVVKVKRK